MKVFQPFGKISCKHSLPLDLMFAYLCLFSEITCLLLIYVLVWETDHWGLCGQHQSVFWWPLYYVKWTNLGNEKESVGQAHSV